jgi:hypothetical protein
MKIKEYALSGLGVERIEIPKSVDEIGDGALAGCSNLKTLLFENAASEHSIQMSATENITFQNCVNLTDIYLGNLIGNFDGSLTAATFHKAGYAIAERGEKFILTIYSDLPEDPQIHFAEDIKESMLLDQEQS